MYLVTFVHECPMGQNVLAWAVLSPATLGLGLFRNTMQIAFVEKVSALSRNPRANVC